MQAMTGLFGENFSFTDHTYKSKFGGPRTYPSFNASADECGQSRRYGGIHNPPSIETGLTFGRQIGLDINHIELVKTQ